MRSTHQQSPDYSRSGQFSRRWSPTVPPSPEEIKLAKFRAARGFIEGTKRYLAERRSEWLWS